MELPGSESAVSTVRPSLAIRARRFGDILVAAGSIFVRRSGALLAGSVAFYSLLSVLPVLFIALSVARLGAREETARVQIVDELTRWVGRDGAATLGELLKGSTLEGSIGTRALHVLVLVYMSTRLFSLLRRSINHLWGVEPKAALGVKETIVQKARRFVVSLAVVVFVEVLLLATVVGKVVLPVMMGRLAFVAQISVLLQVAEVLLSFSVVTVLFAAILKFLPDAAIAWRDLWVGALVTALLFSIGTMLVSVYLSHKATDDTFGDGGALVMLLLWMNYTAQIFFLGVAFTRVWAERRGGGIHALSHATRAAVLE